MAESSILWQNIQRRMVDLGIRNIAQLSKESGVSRTVLQNLKMKPHKSLMSDSALTLAAFLGCGVRWLVSGEGPMNDECLVNDIVTSQTVPVVTLESLSAGVVRADSSVRVSCPTGAKASVFAVDLSSSQIPQTLKERFSENGYLYFDHSHTPVSGKLVITLPSEGVPEIMEFASAYGKAFVKPLHKDIPTKYQMQPLENPSSLFATVVGWATSL